MHPRTIKKQILKNERHAPEARFVVKQNVPEARYLEQVLIGTLSY